MFVSSVPAIYLGGRIGRATGVAVALLVLQIGLNIPAYLLMVRPLIGKCAQEYMGATAKPVSLAVVMGLIVFFLPTVYAGLTIKVGLALQVFMGALIYMILLKTLNREAIAEFRAAFGPAKLSLPG